MPRSGPRRRTTAMPTSTTQAGAAPASTSRGSAMSRRPTRIHPRLCLRGLHRTPGMAGAKRRRDDDWRGAQGHADASGAVVDLHGSVRRVPAAAREPGVAEPSRRRTKWGMPTLDIDMAYGPNELVMRHDMEGSGRRDAAGGRVPVGRRLQQPATSRRGDPRDGHGADGPRSEDIGAQRASTSATTRATCS